MTINNHRETRDGCRARAIFASSTRFSPVRRIRSRGDPKHAERCGSVHSFPLCMQVFAWRKVVFSHIVIKALKTPYNRIEGLGNLLFDFLLELPPRLRTVPSWGFYYSCGVCECRCLHTGLRTHVRAPHGHVHLRVRVRI